MTLTKLLIYVGIISVTLLLGIGLGYKKPKNWLMSFAQYFAGVLFIVSGAVKAVDPLGTAYKMEQYFGEFIYTFQDTWMSFITPIFPLLNNYVIAFSVIMILLEILLGLALIIGFKPKFSAWAFFILVFFFTFLTGFTYLTGYVPAGVNFFSFGEWGPYVETNMKVTDCGCFGDFIKLKPMTSFFKDIFLLIPAFYFIFKHRDMHQLLSAGKRGIMLGVVGIGLLIYCLSNFVWDIPRVDFRPFKKGADVRTLKSAEEEAAINVKITHYKIRNKETGVEITIPYAEYMENFQKYPKEEFELAQVKSLPTIEPTKISDFDFTDSDGISQVEDFLNYDGYSLMVISYKLKPNNAAFIDNYKSKIVPMAQKAEANGIKVFGIAGGAGKEQIEDLRHTVQANFPIYEADDILLKTIVRSNPGVVLWKDGRIIDKWHINKLPTYENIGIQ